MRIQFKRVALCILLIGLNACSSKDHEENNATTENQVKENSVDLGADTEKSLVIVPKEKLSPIQSWEDVEDVRHQHEYSILYPHMRESRYFKSSSFFENYDIIHSQLKLSNDQIFVIGNRDHVTDDNRLFLDLSNDEYFKYANNLAINHIRNMKVPQIEPKQKFEKSEAYEQRVQQAQQDAEESNVDYDLKLLEQALNRSVLDIYFTSSYASYEYDADQEQMLIRFEQPSSYGPVAAMESELLLKINPNLAKNVAEKFNQLRLGYVLNFKDNRLNFDGVFFYYKGIRNPDRHEGTIQEVMYVSPILKPLSFKQKGAAEYVRTGDIGEANEKLKTMPFQDVLTSSAWNFKFGLDQYMSPEAFLKKYPKQETPKELVYQEEPEQL